MPIAALKEEKEIVRIASFHSFVKFLDFSLKFFLGIYLASINLTGTEIGTIFAASTLTSIISVLPSGFSNDKFKSRNLITIALLLSMAFYFGLSQAHTFTSVLILFIAGGMGTTLYLAAADSIFYRATKKQNIAKKVSIFQSFNFIMIGSAMILSGFLLHLEVPFTALFKIVSSLYLLMAILSQFVLPSKEKSEFNILNYKKDIFKKEVLLFMVVAFLFALHFGAELTSYGLFLKEYLELESLYVGLYMGIAIIFMAGASILIGKNSKKWKMNHVVIVGLFLSGIFHILMPIKKPFISFIFRALHEIGDAAVFFFFYYAITKLFHLDRIGGNSAILTFTITVGAAVGALIFGPLGEIYGYHIPIIVSGFTNLLAMLVAIRFTHLLKHN